MFTGIIETIGEALQIESDKENLILTITSSLSSDLKIDQSISHNGVCLTVIDVNANSHTVVAIKETLNKTNIKSIQIGDKINLERCMKADGRFDGHIVQGHVDGVAQLVSIKDEGGSYVLEFQHTNLDYITVEKGSVCVNGISLTVIHSQTHAFSVAIIPYTWENTNLHTLKVGDFVNIEFDIIGKYIQKLTNKN